MGAVNSFEGTWGFEVLEGAWVEVSQEAAKNEIVVTLPLLWKGNAENKKEKKIGQGRRWGKSLRWKEGPQRINSR